jgi:hypothetical protein
MVLWVTVCLEACVGAKKINYNHQPSVLKSFLQNHAREHALSPECRVVHPERLRRMKARMSQSPVPMDRSAGRQEHVYGVDD